MCKCIWDTITGICGCAKDTVCCCCNCVGCLCNFIIIAVVLLVVGGIVVGLLYAFNVFGGGDDTKESTILGVLSSTVRSTDDFEDTFKKFA